MSEIQQDEELKGQSLIEEVITLTGLPKEDLRREMLRALAELEQAPEDLNIEKLRRVVANYVQDVLVGLKNEFDQEE